MAPITKKLQILASLDALNPQQAEKVLNFIKQMLDVSKEDNNYPHPKKDRIAQLRMAIRKKKKSSED